MDSANTSTESAPQLPEAAPWSQLMDQLHHMRSDMQTMAARIERVEGRSPTSSTPHQPARSAVTRPEEAAFSCSTSWAERMDEQDEMLASIGLEEDSIDHEAEVDVRGTKCFQTSARTQSFIKPAFSSSMTNAARQQLKDKFGVPNLPCTASPMLDKVLRARVSSTTKSRDKELAKLQALAMDATGPLTHIVEDACRGSLTAKDNLDAVQSALRFLGNFASQCNKMRRSAVLQNLNPRIADMADEVGLFEDAGLNLFGDGFCKKAKERDDEMKALNSIHRDPNVNRRTEKPSGFRQAPRRPFHNRGGFTQRGRARFSSAPYHATRREPQQHNRSK